MLVWSPLMFDCPSIPLSFPLIGDLCTTQCFCAKNCTTRQLMMWNLVKLASLPPIRSECQTQNDGEMLNPEIAIFPWHQYYPQGYWPWPFHQLWSVPMFIQLCGSKHKTPGCASKKPIFKKGFSLFFYCQISQHLMLATIVPTPLQAANDLQINPTPLR